jgi:hypothetical protein
MPCHRLHITKVCYVVYYSVILASYEDKLYKENTQTFVISMQVCLTLDDLIFQFQTVRLVVQQGDESLYVP